MSAQALEMGLDGKRKTIFFLNGSDAHSSLKSLLRHGKAMFARFGVIKGLGSMLDFNSGCAGIVTKD